MKHRVRCEVSGGVTGTRVSYLKNDGEEVIFPTHAAALEIATDLEQKANSCIYATAYYHYAPEPYVDPAEYRGNDYGDDEPLTEVLEDIARPLPPTPGFSKLGPAAQERALGRAKNFYPFD